MDTGNKRRLYEPLDSGKDLCLAFTSSMVTCGVRMSNITVLAISFKSGKKLMSHIPWPLSSHPKGGTGKGTCKSLCEEFLLKLSTQIAETKRAGNTKSALC